MKPRLLSALAVSTIGVLGLSACSSEPSSKTVAREIVESYSDQLTPEEESCLLGAIEAYDSDDLKKIGEQNENFDGSDAAIEQATPEMQAFIDDLRACRSGTSATTAGSTATTEGSTGTTEASTVTTAASETTEPTDTTDAAAATTAADTTEPTQTTAR